MTGREVQQVRKRLGLTQREFAARVGVTPNAVAKWESGHFTVGKTAAILIRLLDPRRKEGQ